MTTKMSSTLCTTLGNHDIRGDGRATYTKLFGPPYYSFDFADAHFIFLDSSPGWTEKQAISDEQYVWLENDLSKSMGKQIFVISHIPPYDPRSNLTKNEIPNYVIMAENGDNWAEQKLDNYFENKNMDHGFQDPQEAEKFETLMSEYDVNTVYLSHIHGYFEYYRKGVRYLISGGAGAELLTENTYYHYFIANFDNDKAITMVELPSPVNNYIARYMATGKLFAEAMYRENPLPIIFICIGLVLFIILLTLRIYLWKKKQINTLCKWIYDIGEFSIRHFKELF